MYYKYGTGEPNWGYSRRDGIHLTEHDGFCWTWRVEHQSLSWLLYGPTIVNLSQEQEGFFSLSPIASKRYTYMSLGQLVYQHLFVRKAIKLQNESFTDIIFIHTGKRISYNRSKIFLNFIHIFKRNISFGVVTFSLSHISNFDYPIIG